MMWGCGALAVFGTYFFLVKGPWLDVSVLGCWLYLIQSCATSIFKYKLLFA